MNDKPDLIDFENMLILKNQLITLSLESLVEIYSNIPEYIVFVNSVICMLKNESAFLYIDDMFVEKIESVLNIHRFDINDGEIIDVINNLIVLLNTILSTDDNYKKLLVNGYVSYHEDIRNLKVRTINELLHVLLSDSIVFLYLKGMLDILPNEDITLFSINYFLSECPEFFKNDNVYNLTLDKLNEIYNKSNIFSLDTKIITSMAKKKLKRTGLKEE